MDDRTNIKNGFELNKIDFTHVAQEKPALLKKNQSAEKPPDLVCKLSHKITKVSRNRNREIIGGPK